MTSENGNHRANDPELERLVEATGLTLDELRAKLDAASADDKANRDCTIAGAVEAATRALESGAVGTYRSYWKVLTDGIVLPATWDVARIDRYAADLTEVNRRQKLELELPDDIHACPRQRTSDDKPGGLIVHPGYGEERLDAIGQFEAKTLAKWVRAHALAKSAEQDRRRHAKGRPVTRNTGKGAEENFIAATRCLYKAAAANGLVEAGYSPAATMKKPPRRSESARRPMFDAEVNDVWATCSTTGNDPELDSLIFLLQMETASRQEGCINLRLGDLDDELQAVWLDQKGDKLERFPVSATLLRDLRAFATSRGSVELHDPVLRQKGRHRHTGQLNPPLTSRRFDHLHDRVREQHAWANYVSWSSHWIRHHVGAAVEGIGGRPCKMRALDHEPNGQTDLYGKAAFEQLAWAISIWTKAPHPLAQRLPWIGR